MFGFLNEYGRNTPINNEIITGNINREKILLSLIFVNIIFKVNIKLKKIKDSYKFENGACLTIMVLKVISNK